MKLQELFRSENVVTGFVASDKWEAIRRMVEHLTAGGQLPEKAAPALLEAVLHREKSMSTGMERGLAIPHAAVDELDELVACLAVVGDDGLNFESIDRSPTRLIALLLIPRAQKLLHIRTLATVARELGDDAVQHALFEATSPEGAWKVLGGASQPPD